MLHDGRIEQHDTPEDLNEHPATPFVFSFLGNVNLFHGRLSGGRVSIGDSELEVPELAEVRDQAAIAFVPRRFRVFPGDLERKP